MAAEDTVISLKGTDTISQRIPLSESDSVISHSDALPLDVQKAVTRTLEKNKKGLDLLAR